MYIEQPYKGLTDSWMYVLGVFLVFIGWQFIGTIPLVVAIFMKGDGMNVLGSGDIGLMASHLGTNSFLFYALFGFVFGLVSLFLWVKYVHKQTIVALTTSRSKIDWKRIFFAFTMWGTVSVGLTFIGIWLSPENYEINFNLKPFLILAFIGILMIPLQTSMEEYLFRGYLMQSIGIMVKNRWVPLIITSVIFGLMHILNPEVEKLGYLIMVFYIGTGFLLGIMTLMDEGLELALGFHAANNLITALLVTADWTAFQTDSIYRDISDPVLGWDVFIPVLIIYPILLFILSKKYNWSNWKERLAGKVLSKEEFLGNDVDEIGVQ